MAYKLLDNLYQMQQNRENTDCTLIITTSMSETRKDQTFVQAHKIILSASSQIFKRELLVSNRVEISNVNDVDLFKKFIKAIYTGYLDVEKYEETLKIYELAHEYETEDVLKAATTYLIKCCEYFTEKAVIPIINLAHKYDNKELKDACIKQIKTKATKILKSSEFALASSDVVNTIYKMEVINISEIDLLIALRLYIKRNADLDKNAIQSAIHSIRFLLLDDIVIRGCKLIDDTTKERLIALKEDSSEQRDFEGFSLSTCSRQEMFRVPRVVIPRLSSLLIPQMYQPGMPLRNLNPESIN